MESYGLTTFVTAAYATCDILPRKQAKGETLSCHLVPTRVRLWSLPNHILLLF